MEGKRMYHETEAASEEDRTRVVRREWEESASKTIQMPTFDPPTHKGVYCTLIEGIVIHSKFMCNCKFESYLLNAYKEICVSFCLVIISQSCFEIFFSISSYLDLRKMEGRVEFVGVCFFCFSKCADFK